MLKCIFKPLRRLTAGFLGDARGSLTPIFALTLIPLMAAMGSAIDYSRANSSRSKLQSALDIAILAGARDGSSSWDQLAQNVFNANFVDGSALQVSVNFNRNTGQVYQGSARATVQTAFLGLMHISSVNVAVTAAAISVDGDNSCILTLDKGQPSTDVALSLNGAPVVDLSGCSIRSNTSLNCNGHDGSLLKAYAAGMASGCSNPQSYAAGVPDIYAGLASNITTVCGSSRAGVNWTAGTLPNSNAFKTTTNLGRTEYHICGDLTLDGSGNLMGTPPSADALIVIENGSLNLNNGASVSVSRTAIALTGDNSYPSQINFPNGNGKTASLTLSPPLDSSNVWQGVALYQDPKLTNNVNNKWGPGADFNADGLVYLGNSNTVTDGNTSSSNAKCSKFVMNQFVTNGSVYLNFDQSAASCAAIGLKQWNGVIVHLVN